MSIEGGIEEVIFLQVVLELLELVLASSEFLGASIPMHFHVSDDDRILPSIVLQLHSPQL